MPMPSKRRRNEAVLFDYESFFSERIEAKKRDGSYRSFKKVVRHAATFPRVQEHTAQGEHKPVTIWCSNDYLGLGRHPHVQAEVCEAVAKYGVGSGGTRNISGSTPLHVQLEHELAQLHGQPAALLFTSCYVANGNLFFFEIFYSSCFRFRYLANLILISNHSHSLLIHKTQHCTPWPKCCPDVTL